MDNEISVSTCSGVLDRLEEGDSLMGDRGFQIEHHCQAKKIGLNIPPKLGKDFQLSNRDLVETRRITSLRVLLERAIERIKNYHILDVITSNWYHMADILVFVWAMLSNFHEPLVKQIYSPYLLTFSYHHGLSIFFITTI